MRERKFKNKTALRKAVEDYFASISIEKTYTEPVVVGITNRGKPMVEQQPVLDAQGREIKRKVWLRPPTITSLCLFIGISLDTWERYSNEPEKYPGYFDVCENARQIVRAYLEEELVFRDKVQGIIFALENNYNMKNKIEMSGGLESYLKRLDEEGIEPTL